MSSEHPMPPVPDRPVTDVSDEVPAGVRAQLLATEHWSLLAPAARRGRR